MNKKAFTLLEAMIVVILIGIIAAFAIPNYNKSIRKTRERSAVAQLLILHAANELYRDGNNGRYWDTGGADEELAAINSALGINIVAEPGVEYTYASNGGTEYAAYASWNSGGYMIKITEAPIENSVGSINPCCWTSNCLSVEW